MPFDGFASSTRSRAGALTWLPILLMVRAGLPGLAHAEDDAADQAAADQARGPRARSRGTTSPAATRPSTSCARWSSSCARPSASRSSARRCRRASCCTARPAPARRCSRRRSPASPAPTSSASPRARSSRCSPASARRASGACSRSRRSTRPAIIFIDELDAIGLQRGFDLSREKDQTLNQLLVEMDGFEDRGDLIVIAASNRVDGLDPALLRPGRFDRQVLVVAARPRAAASRSCKVHTRNKPVEDVDLEHGRAPHLGPDRRRPREPLQRGGDLRRPRGARHDHARPTSTARSSASSPACRRAA